MVSLVNTQWAREQLPDREIIPLSEFSDTKISLRAANQTDLKIRGVLLIDFSLPKLEFAVTTPFLVTDEPITTPIIGYNLIRFITEKSSEKGLCDIV